MSNPRGTGFTVETRVPSRIWRPFWKGFFEVWAALFRAIPASLAFWNWQWEIIGWVVAMFSVLATIIGILVVLGWYMLP